MVLQNAVLVDSKETRQLYYRGLRSDYEYSKNLLILQDECISSDTYMNSFDISTWKKYTDVSDVYFKVKTSGSGKISLIHEIEGRKTEIGVYSCTTLKDETTEWSCMIPNEYSEGLVYFEANTKTDLEILKASFETEAEVKRDVRLAIVICTYKRQKELERTLATLTESFDFSVLKSRLNVVIVDNASELKNNYGKNIQVYHNPNTGGAGGFSRGMEEVINHLKDFDATHVLLMDDDALVEFESISRLWALLSYVKEKYKKEAVAGRMFRLDKPVVQYTALEIWDRGSIRHIGENTNMELKESLWRMNDNTGGMYGGWWFECYPIEFVKKNKPIPFFIHCDDVEYGLRHGGTPIILNGIQVWHETFDNRQSPSIVYYDVRNSLVVNAIWEKRYVWKRLWRMWARRAVWIITRKKYAEEYMALLGIHDFLKGFQWLVDLDSEENHKNIRSKTDFSWWKNVALCITVFFEIVMKYRKVKETYQ